MDCRRRSAVDDDRSRKTRLAVDDDRHQGRWAADDARSRIAFYQAQSKKSLDQVDRNLDRIRETLRSIRRMRMSSATISRHSSSSIPSSASHKRHLSRHTPTVADDYAPLELLLKWRDPPSEYPPLELPLGWRDPPPLQYQIPVPKSLPLPPDLTNAEPTPSNKSSTKLPATPTADQLPAAPTAADLGLPTTASTKSRETSPAPPNPFSPSVLPADQTPATSTSDSPTPCFVGCLPELDTAISPSLLCSTNTQGQSTLLPPAYSPAFQSLQQNATLQLAEQSHAKSSPIVTGEATAAAIPPLPLALSSDPSTRHPKLEAKEKPLYEIDSEKNPASSNPPIVYSILSFESSEGYQSRNTHCGSIKNINGFANNNKKRGSSVSISQEMLENGDEDKGKDFWWSPDPGGTTLPICRVVVAFLGGATVPSPSFLLFFLAGKSSFPRPCSSSTEKNNLLTQPALHAICLIKCLTRVPLPPCSDQALENVHEIVLYFLTSCSDRDVASLIGKSWFNAETLIRLEFFIGNCYAVSKEKEEWNTPKPRHTSLLKGALNSKILNERMFELWASLAPQEWKLCIPSTSITGCPVKSNGFILVFLKLNQQRMGIFYVVKILNATLVLVEKMGIPDTKTGSRFYDSKFAAEHSIGHNTVKLGCCDWWINRSKRIATLEFDGVHKSMSQLELIVFLSRVLLNVFWKEVLMYSSPMIQLCQWTNNTGNCIVLQSRERFILTAYSKMDCFEQTERLFHFMEKMSFISCNILMLAYLSAGDFFKLVECFPRLTAEIAPDVHNRLTEEEKVKICCPINYEQLSLQSCKDLAQTLKFLLKIVVQVLLSQQSKLKGLFQECNRFKSFDTKQKQSKDCTFTERCKIFDPGGLLHSTPSPMTRLDRVEPFWTQGEYDVGTSLVE